MIYQTGKRWDIFCKIVDNYGDIGVCWRLSKQLAHEHNLQVRLIVDDIQTASKIISDLDITQQLQIINGIEVCVWDETHLSNTPIDVILETFSCGLPDEYIQKIRPETIWINLEYLSAEAWVSEFHAKPSKHPTLGLTKYFFFPGFLENTGGLIRESNLIAQRDAFLNSPTIQNHFWQQITNSNDINFIKNIAEINTLKVSLFCYPQAQIKNLLYALENNAQPVSLFIPFNRTLTTLSDILLDFNNKIGEVFHTKNLKVFVLPFLSQTDYDHLLWVCDLNFVRGEDSWIRAIWAGKPFIWQPYLQSDNTHIKKLDAFLDVYLKSASEDVKATLSQASFTWSNKSYSQKQQNTINGQDNTTDECIWQQLINHLPMLHQHSNQEAKILAAQSDLAIKLVLFSESLQENKV